MELVSVLPKSIVGVGFYSLTFSSFYSSFYIFLGLSSDYPPHLLGEDDGLLPFPMTTTKNLRNDKDEETVSCGSNREETCKLCF
ncbi:unnamed protein product [Linum tenue]|uniref:Uncharacterized protein n=1 Tax=Linum tenue TaxID=586396 RepID=A0AAV0IQI7_9ROSI|nr:unnamed protein product [Linum tenue]CAI0554015.1 unnamed protein product [Linum tenue]